jgi:hypothetical protein
VNEKIKMLEGAPGDLSVGRVGFFIVIISAVVPYVFHVVWRTVSNGIIDSQLVMAVVGLVGTAFAGKWAQKKEEVKAEIGGGEK